MRLFQTLLDVKRFADAQRRALFLFVCVLFLMSGAGTMLAQSGRRAPKNPSPVPTPSPTSPSSSSSETKPKAADTKTALYTFLIFEDSNTSVNIPLNADMAAFRGFSGRLREASDLLINDGGRGDRGRARDAAKKETTTYVVLVHLDADSFNSGRTGQVDPSNIAVRYFVYTPGTGTLKHQGSVYMRPNQSRVGVGGIRLPGRGGPFAFESMLEQAGRDAADRLMRNFNLRLPPDNR